MGCGGGGGVERSEGIYIYIYIDVLRNIMFCGSRELHPEIMSFRCISNNKSREEIWISDGALLVIRLGHRPASV